MGKTMDIMDAEYEAMNTKKMQEAEELANPNVQAPPVVEELDTIEVDDDGETQDEDEIQVENIPF